jgi:hypothetical protein
MVVSDVVNAAPPAVRAPYSHLVPFANVPDMAKTGLTGTFGVIPCHDALISLIIVFFG